MQECPIKKQIEWNGFLKHAVDSLPNEACGFLYSDKPFEEDGKWFVFPVENVSDNPTDVWKPDKREMREIKKKARKLKLILIGNIHTHPLPLAKEGLTLDAMDEAIKPSKTDLRFAKRYNDIIRGIIICNKNAILGIEFHDMFGRKIDINVNLF